MKVLATEAQNIFVVDDEKILWSSDGVYDIRQDFGAKHMTHSQLQEIQDMWPEPDAEMAMERMFDYGPDFVPLGLLTRDGTIFAINQEVEPGVLTKRTSSQIRRPFRHALIRQEVNNGKGDTWPCVIFDEQPCTIYRLQTVEDLLRWLGGTAVSFSALKLPSNIAQLLTCGGVKGEDCMALTEDGKVYYWARDAPMSSQTKILSKVLHPSPSSEELHGRIDSEESGRAQDIQIISIPPIIRLVAGPVYGAAITTGGQLYVFLTSRPRCNDQNECIEPTLAELYIPTSDKPFILYPPYMPQLAQIPISEQQESSNPPKIIDIAIGYNHLVALAQDGQVFTAGDGMHGQLGVGEVQQFQLHAIKHQMNENEESWEFAEHWQKIDIADDEKARGFSAGAGADGEIRTRVSAVHAGCDSTLLIVGKC